MAEKARESKELEHEKAVARREPAWSPAQMRREGRPGSPFGLMRRFMDEMDHLFDDFGFGSLMPRIELLPRAWEEGEGAWSPDVEIVERGGQLCVRADLPGFSKDDVEVEIEGGALHIRGERRQEHEERKRGVYRTERSYGTFYRAIPLPEGVDPDKAAATFKNGVLEVTLPLPERAARGRRIDIREGGRGSQGDGGRPERLTAIVLVGSPGAVSPCRRAAPRRARPRARGRWPRVRSHSASARCR